MPGWVTARVAATRERPDTLAATQVGLGRRTALAEEVEGGAHGRQQCRGDPGVAGRARVEAVLAEHDVRLGRERLAQQVADRHRPAAGLHDGDRLGGCEVAGPAAGEQPQGLRHGFDGARGRGRCRRRPRRRRSRRLRTAISRWRTATDLSMRWVTSLAPTMMTATSGSGTAASAALDLLVEAGGLGADDRDVGQLDRAAAEGGDARRDRRTDGLVRVVRAHPDAGRVAEHEEPQGVAGPGAVGAAVGRGALEGLAHDPCGPSSPRPAGSRSRGRRARRDPRRPPRRRRRPPARSCARAVHAPCRSPSSCASRCSHRVHHGNARARRSVPGSHVAAGDGRRGARVSRPWDSPPRMGG